MLWDELVVAPRAMLMPGFCVTLTVDVPVSVTLLLVAVAVTVYVPIEVGAVYCPDDVMVPPPVLTLHVRVVGVNTFPNWSFTASVNVCVVLVFSDTVDGDTVTVVGTEVNVTA